MPLTDSERLVVTLEARVRDFEKNFERANKTARRNFGSIEKRAAKSSTRLQKTMAGASAGIQKSLAGILSKTGLAGIGLAGVAAGIVSVASSIADVGREAKRAGVDLKSFQELKFVAENAAIPIDALVDGLKELNLRGDEFIETAGGPAAEAFARLGYSAEDLETKLKNPSDLLVEIIGRMQKLNKSSQIRVSDELFGGSAGERFVELLDQSADGIREQITQANKLGVVLDEEMIAKATEVDKKFRIITQVVGTNLKSAIVSAASELESFLDKFKEVENRQTLTLQHSLADIYKEREEVAEKIQNTTSELHLERLENLDKKLVQRALKIRDLLDRRQGFSEDFVYSPDPKSKSDEFEYKPGKTAAQIKQEAKAEKSRIRAADAVKKEREEVEKLISSLQEELRLVTATDAERRAADILRSSNSSATDQEREKIVALNEEIHGTELALREAAEAQAFLANASTDALTDVLTGASSAEDALRDLALAFVRAALKAVILKAVSGGPTKSFGDFIGPRFVATGGMIRGPGSSTSDSIPAMLSDGEYVVRASATKKHRALLEAINTDQIPRFATGGLVGNMPSGIGSSSSNSPMSISISAPITVNGGGGTPDQNDDLSKQISQQMEATMRGVVVDELRQQMRPGNMLGN